MTREELLENARPILFNTEMVRAILAGRKTVTRRVMKPQPWKIGEGEYECRHEKGFYDMGGNDWACRQCGCGVIPMKGGSYFHAPYQPGDILYVRETWAEWTGGYLYRAWPDGIHQPGAYKDMPWNPSIHMPKEAARIFLRVTNVRVERLQDITIDEIRNEGLTSMAVYAGDMEIALAEWKILWESTIKKNNLARYGWNANPWVWVINFERVVDDENTD